MNTIKLLEKVATPLNELMMTWRIDDLMLELEGGHKSSIKRHNPTEFSLYDSY